MQTSARERQIALIIGSVAAAAVVGAGIFYFYRRKGNRQQASNSKSFVSHNVSSKVEPAKKTATPLDKALALKTKGNQLFKDGKYAEAIKFYTDAINECPTDASAVDISAFYQNRAAAYEKLENYNAVVDDCTEALSKNNRYTKAMSRRAKAYERLERYDEALRDYTATCFLEEFQNVATMQSADDVLKQLSVAKAAQIMAERAGRAIPLSPTFVDSYFLSFAMDPILDDLSKKSEINVAVVNGEVQIVETPSGYEKAKNLLKEKRYDNIIAACDEEIENHGKHIVEAMLLRLTFDLIVGAIHQAAVDFDRLMDLIKQCDKSESDIRRIKSNALIKRACMYMQEGKKDDALADFRAAEEADPSNADVLHHKGQLLFLLNEVVEARTNFEKAVNLRPDVAIWAAHRCYAEYRYAMATKNPLAMHQAMAEFERLVEKFSHCADAYALFGQVMAEQQQYEEAKKLFNKGIKLAPKNANIYVHKALVQSEGGDVEEAVKTIEESLKIDHNCEFAYETLAAIELQRGNIDRALEHYEKAIQLARTSMEVAHIISLREAASAQKSTAQTYGEPSANFFKM